MAERSWRRLLVVGTVAVAAIAPTTATIAPAAAGPTPQPFNGTFSGDNGVTRIQDPGRRCSEPGGSGQYRHVSLEAPVAPLLSANLPGFIRATLDVHHDGDEPVGTPLTGAAATAFLQGTESHVTTSNQRGSVQRRLTSGTCAAPSLTFDGTKVSGDGTWAITSATGAYRNASGTGKFTLTNVGVAPGADNPWTMTFFDGNITVLQPSLKVDVVSTSWGNLGLDYVTRRVTVVYRVTNTGPGDAFGTVMTQTYSPTAGVTPIGPQPQNLGDLLNGESTTFSVRYQFSLLSGPCKLVILNCQFDTTISVSMPDALDQATAPPPASSQRVTAPNFPPPL